MGALCGGVLGVWCCVLCSECVMDVLCGGVLGVLGGVLWVYCGDCVMGVLYGECVIGMLCGECYSECVKGVCGVMLCQLGYHGCRMRHMAQLYYCQCVWWA